MIQPTQTPAGSAAEVLYKGLATAAIPEDQVAALRRVVGFFRDAERVRRAGLDVDAGDIIGRGLRETVAEERDIALLETLLSAQER